MMTEARQFRCSVRVYFEDTDAGGIVYNANYLRYAERGRAEMLRDLGFESLRLIETDGVALAVCRCYTDYLYPAHLDDALDVATRVTRVGGASVNVLQKVTRGDDALVTLDIKLGSIKSDGSPARLPIDLRAALKNACENLA